MAKWLKNKGDKVTSDEPLVELETDKVNVEVPAPSNGILDNIAAKEGETVNVGALLGSITQLNQATTSSKLDKNEKNILRQSQKRKPKILKYRDKLKKIKKNLSVLLCLKKNQT